MIKVIIYGCCKNDPFLVILQEQIPPVWSIGIIWGLEAFMLWGTKLIFKVPAVNLIYLEIDKANTMKQAVFQS